MTTNESQIRNSLAEGKNILRAGSFNGRKLTVQELLAVRRSVESDLQKLGLNRVPKNIEFTITDVTPAGY